EDIGVAGIRSRESAIVSRRTDDDIGVAVAVQVAGAGNRAAKVGSNCRAVDAEAVAAIQGRGVDGGVERTAMSEDHEGGSCVVGHVRPAADTDHQVIISVPVYVTGRRDPLVRCPHFGAAEAGDGESVAAIESGGEYPRVKLARMAEYDVGRDSAVAGIVVG